MGERRGTRGLELWCKRMTEGYPGVKVDNMTTSWRDGLAFCAIIHHFRPDLIDFSKLNKNDIYYNNKLAFRVAEDHLGIPALLEPEDMVEYTVPDRLSILTYLSQFYQAFAVNQSNSTVKTPTKRPPPSDIQMHMVSSTSSTPPKKAALRLSGARREPCAKCGLPVFIAERLNVGEALYHRTCFRCARCDSQLTLMNYYETENRDFCCETCPDEETPTRSNANILSKSLSDEEKSAGLKVESDIFSSNFENALEHPKDDSLRHNFTLDKAAGAAFMRARADFMTTQVDISDSDSDSSREQKPPDLPTSKIPEIVHKDGAHIENMDADGVNMLPTFSASNPLSSKLKKPTVVESQDAVTKDSVSVEDKPAMSSFKSRIKLFEDIADNREIRKSDVNKESLRLSTKIDKVPYAKSYETIDVNLELSSNDKEDEECSVKTKNENVIRSVSGRVYEISPNDDFSTLNKSELSESYQADISDLRDTSSEQNDSIIESSIHTSNDNFVTCHSVKSQIMTTSSSVPQESVIITTSQSSFDNKNEMGTSFDSKGINESLDQYNESPIVLSSEISSEYRNEISQSSTSKREDKEDEAVIDSVISKTRDIEQSSKNASISKIMTPSSNVPQESVIITTSQSSFDIKNEKGTSSDSKEINESLDQYNKSPIVLSSEISSEYKNEISQSSTRKREDKEDEAVIESVISKTRDIIKQSSKNANLENVNPFGSDDDEAIEEKSVAKTSKSTSLNPFDDSEEEEIAPLPPKSTSLNPFGDSDEEDEEAVKRPEVNKPVPVPRLIIPPKSMNPFESDDEDVEELPPPPPPQPAVRKLIKADRVSLTPCWQDDFSPIPKTRSHARNTSNTSSLSGSGRKKKPAPKPPSAASCFNQDAIESAVSSVNSSPCQSLCPSPKLPAKTRKIKRAPLPPSSTPLRTEATNFALPVSPIDHKEMDSKPLLFRVGSAENLKSTKDEINRNKQTNASLPSTEGPSSLPNKSTYGKWKRRKGQAPVRPIPQRRTIKNLPLDEIKHELELIEIQQLGLEKQGVMLEKLIRERSEVPGVSEDEILAPETQDMLIQLFDLVNEKNDLFRKQAELMYLRRQHRLEEEYAEVEYQIRYLMLQPESNKTDSDKEKEDALINRLVKIVERRNEIVDRVEMDRQRAADEDNSITSEMSLFKMKLEDSSTVKKKLNKKDKSKPKKDKEKKNKSKYKVDVDKDIDEIETSISKEKKKRKFNIF
ncbi:hypothetical protein WA026_015914 [Henosepilachna vigintioctopunctata]|uniref:MICAL-like protein 1 n=1 Tax=Henosepilachna vigintioctopunctata TaxID=420089 RepID=A0AAW1U2U8_9CUCU